MDTNKDRQQYSEYGLGEYGTNAGRGCLVWLLALGIAVAFLLSMMPQ